MTHVAYSSLFGPADAVLAARRDARYPCTFASEIEKVFYGVGAASVHKLIFHVTTAEREISGVPDAISMTRTKQTTALCRHNHKMLADAEDVVDASHVRPAYTYKFNSSVDIIALETELFTNLSPSDDGIPKGVKFSPDGLLLLTATSRSLIVGDIPMNSFQDDPLHPNDVVGITCRLTISCPSLLYCYEWYPGVDSWSCPESALLLASSKDQPIVLWDAFTGSQRAQYVGYNHLDEVIPALAVAFNADGTRVYGGYDMSIQMFDVSRPGRSIAKANTSSTRKSCHGQRGLISAISANNFNGDGDALIACGSYAGSVWCYDPISLSSVCSLHELDAHRVHARGVTQVEWSSDGRTVFAAYRNSTHITAWDVRNNKAPLGVFLRDANTNQHLKFAVNGNLLVTPCRSKGVVVYDWLTGEEQAVIGEPGSSVNGVSLHPRGVVAALTCGERIWEYPEAAYGTHCAVTQIPTAATGASLEPRNLLSASRSSSVILDGAKALHKWPESFALDRAQSCIALVRTQAS
jgi:WD40 repeat protein